MNAHRESLGEAGPPSPRLAIFLAFSGVGGVESGILNLISAFLEAGVEVDLLGIFKNGMPAALQAERSGLRVLDLGVHHTHLAVPALYRYFRDQRPRVMLAAKDRAIRVAVLARALARTNTRIVGQLNTHLSASLESKPAWRRLGRTLPMRAFYPHVDQVVAVSEGVALDTHRLTGLPLDRIPVIRNPVIGPELYRQSRLPPEHPWLAETAIPVIVGAGRLTVQKDFPTLLRAFARLRAQRPCRLIILGEGGQRATLESVVAELGIGADVALPGHTGNPFATMARASLFVLSSRWEGSGNVLTEAMALGVPVVSTDCPSGPAEMLQDGRFGPLVPVGDVEGLAAAMGRTLDQPLPVETLRAAVADYSIARSAENYLKLLGFLPG